MRTSTPLPTPSQQPNSSASVHDKEKYRQWEASFALNAFGSTLKETMEQSLIPYAVPAGSFREVSGFRKNIEESSNWIRRPYHTRESITILPSGRAASLLQAECLYTTYAPGETPRGDLDSAGYELLSRLGIHSAALRHWPPRQPRALLFRQKDAKGEGTVEHCIGFDPASPHMVRYAMRRRNFSNIPSAVVNGLGVQRDIKSFYSVSIEYHDSGKRYWHRALSGILSKPVRDVASFCGDVAQAVQRAMVPSGRLERHTYLEGLLRWCETPFGY